jgi:CheY-like chemotaxis protein
MSVDLGSIVRHRILIVDDSQDNVDMLEAFLADEASSIKSLTDSNQVEHVLPNSSQTSFC